MIEGLWSLEFGSTLGYEGAGVVIFESGKIFGGDSIYYYIGKYVVEQNILKAEATITHYHGEPSSIFGPSKEHKIKMIGTIAANQFIAKGFLVGNEQMEMATRLTKRAELP